MPILAQMWMEATVTLAPLAAMEFDARLEEPGGGYDPERVLVLDGELDVALTEAARPRSGRRQIVYMRMLLDGEVINPGRLLPSLSVDFPLGQPAGWSVAFPVRNGWEYDSPMGGSATDFYGPPPGDAAIDIEGVYITPAGPRVVRLLTNGVAATADESETEAGDLDTIQGGDAFLRVDQKLLTLVLPPGHGLTRGGVVGRGLAQIGLSNHSLAAGGRCYKEVQWVDAQGLGQLNEFLGIESRVLQLDPHAVVENPRSVLDQGRRVDWTFQRGDLLARTGVRKSSSADGPTRITLTGSRQITRDTCGRFTAPVQEILQIGPKLPTTAAFRQAFDGVLTAYVPASPPVLDEDALISRTLITTEYDCDTVISERVQEWGWFNPRTWRYKLNSATTVYGFNSTGYNPNAYLMETEATAGDGTEAYLWPQERFVQVSDTITTYQFDADGYKTGAVVTRHGWVLPRVGLKETASPGAAAWDTIDWKGVRILAGGDGVGDPSGVPLTGTEFYTGAVTLAGLPVFTGYVEEQTVQAFTNTADGYRQGQSETISRILAETGGRDTSGKVHLYNGNEEKDRDRETLRVAEIRAERYYPETETSHASIVTRTRANGEPLEPATIDHPRSGWLPLADRRNDIEPPASTYETAEEAAFALAASRFDSQPIKASVHSPALATFREEWELKRQEPWAENVRELEARAVDELRELSSQRISYELPANFLIRPGQVASVPFRRRALVHLIARVSTAQQQNEITTRVEGKVYVI